MALRAYLPVPTRCERCNGTAVSITVSTHFERPGAAQVLACTNCNWTDGPPLYRSISDEAWGKLLELSDQRRPYAEEPDLQPIGDPWACRNGHARSEHGEVRVRSDGRSWWMCRSCIATQSEARSAWNQQVLAKARDANAKAVKASFAAKAQERAAKAIATEIARANKTQERAAKVIATETARVKKAQERALKAKATEMARAAKVKEPLMCRAGHDRQVDSVLVDDIRGKSWWRCVRCAREKRVAREKGVTL